MAWVGAVLFGRDLNVIEAAEFMGLSNQLETAVLGIGSIQCDHETQHLGCDTAVVIPIAVVLMPLPRAADLWVFGCEPKSRGIIETSTTLDKVAPTWTCDPPLRLMHRMGGVLGCR